PRSSSLWAALSLSRTSALVRPETFRRTRLPSGPKADRDRPDVAVLRRVEVDRVLAVTATARCVVRHAGSVTLFLAPRLAPRFGSRSPKGPLSWWSGAGSNCRPSANEC